MMTPRLVAAGLLIPTLVFAQDQDQETGDSKAATSGARPPQMNEGFIGRDIPAFDPGSEVASFDGKLWNINNNRLVRARFEKYLNAPPATGEADVAYRKTIDRILELLAPGNESKTNIDLAFSLLPKASEYRDDANLCRSMADAIHSARRSFKTIENLKRENKILERQRKDAEWNNRMAAQTSSLDAPPSTASDAAIAAYQENAKFQRKAKMSATQRELDEINQTIKNNKLRIAVSELNTRGHLQALIMQYFATRRFEHVIIANRFYRAIYKDGDNSIDVYRKMVNSMPVNKDAGQAKISGELDSASGVNFGFQNFSIESLTGGMAVAAQTLSKLVSSLSQIDSLASEAIRDVNEGIAAYKFLLEQGELNSATERLAETFALGEFMPSVRTLSLEDKRQTVKYVQMKNELLAALEVNDLTRAEKLVNEMTAMASDFDASKPIAKIETAKTISAMHLAKAKNAAVSGDRAVMESELRAATEIWPRNPALAEQTIFKQIDVQQEALNELDRLMEQKNHRAIYKERERFMTAIALLYPEQDEEEKLLEQDEQDEGKKLKTQFEQILNQMAEIEGVLQMAREIYDRDKIGAWEGIKQAVSKYPEDIELNRQLAAYSIDAVDFVGALAKGDEMQSRGDYGAAMAWFLDAHRQYPPSKFAQEKIDILAEMILPGSSTGSK